MVAYNYLMERYRDGRYFSAAAGDTRGGGPSFLFGRPRLDFREDVFTRRPAKGTSSQRFHDSRSLSFKADHLHFAGSETKCRETTYLI